MNELEHYKVSGRRASEISANIEELVRTAEAPPGTRLPTIRALADHLGVSAQTVATAYKDLARRGLVRSYGRRGTVVSHTPSVRVPSPIAQQRGLLDLASGNPDPELLFTGSALPTAPLEPILYGSPPVLKEFSDVAADRFAYDGVPADNLVVTAGSLDAIERALSAHLRYGDPVGLEDPGYSAILDLVQAAGYTPVSLPIDQEGPTPEGVRAALSDGIRAMICTPRAQNPTGARITPKRAKALVALLRGATDTLVIEDDHAADIVSAPFKWIGDRSDSHRRWLTIRSLSKSVNPDLRIAVSAGDPVTVSRMAGRYALGPGWVSNHLQAAAAWAWSDEGAQSRLDSATKAYDLRRMALRSALANRGIASQGESGFNVWIPCADEQLVTLRLSELGYAVAPGTRFRQVAEPGIRITTSTLSPDSVDVVAAAVHDAMRGGSPDWAGTRTG